MEVHFRSIKVGEMTWLLWQCQQELVRLFAILENTLAAISFHPARPRRHQLRRVHAQRDALVLPAPAARPTPIAF